MERNVIWRMVACKGSDTLDNDLCFLRIMYTGRAIERILSTEVELNRPVRVAR